MKLLKKFYFHLRVGTGEEKMTTIVFIILILFSLGYKHRSLVEKFLDKTYIHLKCWEY